MGTIQFILHQWQQQISSIGGSVFRLTNGLVLIAVIFLPIEWFFALHRGKVLRQGMVRDLGYYYLNNLLPGLALVVPTALIVWVLHRFLPVAVHHWVAGLSVWSRYGAALFVGEIGFYWGHRWSHEIPWLWRFHAVHHSTEEMDWLANTKAHPLDLVFTRVCSFVPIYVLGLAQPLANGVDGVPIAVTLVSSFWGYFIHANLRWRFGWLEWCIATPAFHHWHHTNDGTEVLNKNYSALLPGLDKLFGTLHLPGRLPEKYGTDTRVPSGLLGQILEPFRRRRPPEPVVSAAASQASLIPEAEDGH